MRSLHIEGSFGIKPRSLNKLQEPHSNLNLALKPSSTQKRSHRNRNAQVVKVMNSSNRKLLTPTESGNFLALGELESLRPNDKSKMSIPSFSIIKCLLKPKGGGTVLKNETYTK